MNKLTMIIEEAEIDNQTYDIEMPRNKKFLNVLTDRDNCGKSRADISACQPELYFTMLKENMCHESSVELQQVPIEQNESELYMLQTSPTLQLTKVNFFNESVDASTKSLKRSLAKADLSSDNTNEGESIISTAEEHLTSKINLKQTDLKNLKPKSTSSTASLLNLIKPKKKIQKPQVAAQSNKSMTFNVDFASTPKKTIPRSSTPKAIKVKRSLREKLSEPFSSTVISMQVSSKTSKNMLNLIKKTIPPPLLSSSAAHPNESLKLRKRARCSTSQDKESSSKRSHKDSQRKSKRSKRSSSCKQCEMIKYSKKTSNQDVIKLLKEPFRAFNVAAAAQQQEFKFPIKYLPNLKSQDIDRLNGCDDYISYENNMRPVQKATSSYSYGDYNVWYL